MTTVDLTALYREDATRPTADTDPGECAWCFAEAFGDPPCPYHGEAAQRRGEWPR